MTSRDFVYWLQGLFELAEPLTLNKKQTEAIKNHLSMVFVHEIDPSMGNQEHQGKLNAVHSGQKQPHSTQLDHSTSATKTNTSKEEKLPPQLPSIPIFLENTDSIPPLVSPSIAKNKKDLIYRC